MLSFVRESGREKAPMAIAKGAFGLSGTGALLDVTGPSDTTLCHVSALGGFPSIGSSIDGFAGSCRFVASPSLMASS